MLSRVRSILINNMSLKIASMLVAIVLWFVVLGSRNVEVAKEVPLEIITPADLVIGNEVPDRVTFRLSGPQAFLRNILNRKEEPIRVNLSQTKPGLVTYRFFSDNLQVPIGVKVLSINPTSIIVKLENVKRKEVPVKLVIRGDPPAGFRAQRLTLVKSTVRIRGAESKVDQVMEVPTQPLDLTQLRDTGERDIAVDLSKMPGVVVDGEFPKVGFEFIQNTANFKIRNIEIKVLTTRRSVADPKEAAIFIRCSAEELKTLDRTKIFAVADAKGKGPGVFELPLNAQLPPNVKLISISPPKAKITIY